MKHAQLYSASKLFSSCHIIAFASALGGHLRYRVSGFCQFSLLEIELGGGLILSRFLQVFSCYGQQQWKHSGILECN